MEKVIESYVMKKHTHYNSYGRYIKKFLQYFVDVARRPDGNTDNCIMMKRSKSEGK